eukprot:6716533-Alexandrium_andersonii.AAC.1
MAAWAVRFAPSASRPCSTAWSWARLPPLSQAFVAAPKAHAFPKTSGGELAHRAGLRTERPPPPADAGQGTRIPNRH